MGLNETGSRGEVQVSEFPRGGPKAGACLGVPSPLLCPEPMLFLKSCAPSNRLQSVGTLKGKAVPVCKALTIKPEV